MKQLSSLIKEFIPLARSDLRGWFISNYHPEFSEQLIKQLDLYELAWPVINTLQNRGTSHLMAVLEATDEKTLHALALITQDSDLSRLVATFLITNSQDLELIDRNYLIQFLRQPDLDGWLTRYLESLVLQSTIHLSLRLLVVTFSVTTNPMLQLAELLNILAEYPFKIHPETIKSIINTYQQQLQKQSCATTSELLILVLNILIERLDPTGQKELIRELDPDVLLLLVEHCLRGSIQDRSSYQKACETLLFLLCAKGTVISEKSLLLIQRRLACPDPYLFETPIVQEVAERLIGNAMLQEQTQVEWISYLLTQSEFVAISSAKILKQLSNRYSLYVLSLQHGPISTVAIKNCSNHLFGQLERACQQSNSASDYQALGVLYTYYYQNLADLRPNLHLEIADAETVQTIEKQCSFASLDLMVRHLDDTSAFNVLAKTSHPMNAMNLFYIILSHDQKRQVFLTGAYDTEFHQFLDKNGTTMCLAKFMENFSDKPWFSAGLQRFGSYVTLHNKEPILSDALAILSPKTPVLQGLIDTEESAAIVLKEFLGDTAQGAIQEVKNPEIKKVTEYFVHDMPRDYLLEVIRTLDTRLGSSQCKLVLHILNEQHHQLLRPGLSWSTMELNKLTCFINQLIEEKNPLDKNRTISYRILRDLMFRSAALGDISFFYKQSRLNPIVTRLSFNQKIPIICAYLLSYCGERQSLLTLLCDYFNTFKNEKSYLHPVSKLLRQFPTRGMSAVLFEALELTTRKNPDFFDRTIFHDMAVYYSKKTGQDFTSPQAELNLLSYFGHEKYYPLVRKGCEELAKDCTDKKLRKRLTQGAKEATVEQNLSKHLQHAYFGMIKVITRVWYYGFKREKGLSKLVTFCDVPSSNPQRVASVNHVNLPALSRKAANADTSFGDKRKQLINLLATIHRSTVPAALITAASPSSRHRLFKTHDIDSDRVQTRDVTSQQAVVNI